jgi:hypothetical protein
MLISQIPQTDIEKDIDANGRKCVPNNAKNIF